MQFNVAGLMKEPIGRVRQYDLEEDLSVLAPEIQAQSPLTGRLQLLRINSGVLATGNLQVSVHTACTRCTEPLSVVVALHIEESYRPLTDVKSGRFLLPDEIEGAEDDLFDAALLINDHHILDLTEIVRQNIWTSMPMRPACAFAQAEECPNYQLRLREMAETLGKSAEDPPESPVDPRWAALLALQVPGEAAQE